MGVQIRFHLPPAEQAIVDELVARAADEAWVERLFAGDTSLWTDDPDVAADITDRLGWLRSPAHFAVQLPALEAFGDAIRDAGFDTAVVMGMGGSSLAPDVFRRTFGSVEGYPQLRILDSTDPAAVSATVDDLDPLETLWIVASKSGTTTEPLAFMADAWARVEAALDERSPDQKPGEFFALITDPDRSVRAIPHHDEVREQFLNPPDIGGRYSAISYVGLVPAAIIGLDLDALLAAANTELAESQEPNPRHNGPVLLGLVLGGLARNGRDKLTFVMDPSIASLGAWLEQLIAESTGKQGTGIVPVDLEPPRPADAYADDRVFAAISVAGGTPDPVGAAAEALAGAGQPVIRIELDDPIDLAGEMVGWEIATAIAGAVLGINPFDQPNVEDAKERTRRVLAGADGADGADGGDDADDAASAGRGAAVEDGGGIHVAAHDPESLAELLRPTLAALQPPNYVALQAFIAPSPATDEALAGIRRALAATRCATTAGYGPRFLHSTGQLHKGGPPTGVFVQLTSDHPGDRRIPGWPYTFGRLIDAQARGDREALRAGGRPVIHLHLGADLPADLATIERAVTLALG